MGRQKAEWPRLLGLKLRALEYAVADEAADPAAVAGQLSHWIAALSQMPPYRMEYHDHFAYWDNFFLAAGIMDALPAELRSASELEILHKAFFRSLESALGHVHDKLTEFSIVSLELEHPRFWSQREGVIEWTNLTEQDYPTRRQLSLLAPAAVPEGLKKLHQLKDLKAEIEYQMQAIVKFGAIADNKYFSHSERMLAEAGMVYVAMYSDSRFLNFISVPDFGATAFGQRLRDKREGASKDCSKLIEVIEGFRA